MKMDPQRKKVFYYAAASRCLFLVFSAVVATIIPNYKSDAFKIPSLLYEELNSDDIVVWKLFGGLLQWDAHHYLHIAEFGYSFENNLAFLPLFPFVVKFGGALLRLCSLVNSVLPANLLSAVIINNVVFVKSALVLYDLTLFVFNDTHFAFRSAIFLCISPATVFFIAPYTETLFSYCAFNGMLAFSRRQTNRSLFWFFLSCCLRSNGVTFAGFILHAWAICCISQLTFTTLIQKIKIIVRFVVYSIQYVFIISSPYIVFQLYSYLLYCYFKPSYGLQLVKDYADQYKLRMASDHINWCYNGVIFPYFTIQEKLWDVGFLKYYKLKQIPNFLLAFPVCYLIIYHCTVYIKSNWKLLFNGPTIYIYNLYPFERKKFCGEFPPYVFLFSIHVLFLNIWGLLNINVQVLTRLIASSSPMVYWIAANAFEGLTKSSKKKFNVNGLFLLPFENGLILDTKAYFVKWYFLTYSFIGIILFCNELPWT